MKPIPFGSLGETSKSHLRFYLLSVSVRKFGQNRILHVSVATWHVFKMVSLGTVFELVVHK